MTPAHTELLLLLKCNRDLWDNHLVYKCRSDPRIRPNVAVQAVEGDEQMQRLNSLSSYWMVTKSKGMPSWNVAKMPTSGTTII